MSIEPVRQVTSITPDAAISALLSLFRDYTLQEPMQSLRLRHRICLHLKSLATRGDLPENLRATCEELQDAWQQALDRRHGRLP